MYRNWIEVRAYMLDRQQELLRLAEASRKAGKGAKPGPRPPGFFLRLLRGVREPG